MYTSNEILELVNEALENKVYDRKPQSLYEPMKYVLSLGGKRIRPVLMLMAYNLYREDVSRIMTNALAIETYHNYTLLHDDLMDRADVRRGKPCVHKVWDDNTAILSGDAMLVLSYQMMAQCDRDKLAQVMDLYTETALQIGEGQQYDVDFENRMDVKAEEYVEMIRLKTSVLLACAMKMGAMQAGAPAEDCELLYRFGESIGLAFQLQDDLLDVYADEKLFGKKIGGDICCNKKTFLLITALNLASPEQFAEMKQWIDKKEFDEQEKIAFFTDMYNKLGVRDICEKRIESLFAMCDNYIDRISVPEDKKANLKAFANSLLNRKL